MKLGNELKVERTRLGEKGKAVAAAIGISPQQLYNIEQGDFTAQTKYIAYLRKQGVDINNLFDRMIEDEKNTENK